ncbi:MAG: ScpA family protein [Acetanaerobacterium sp.]
MDKMSFKLDSFEGPLDLLLHLIAKHKLNIYDISIFELVTQYTEYISNLRREDMEVASEFVEMAARLVHIKSAMLLPRHDEGEKLRQELAGQLLEYALIKRISVLFAAQYVGGAIFTSKPMPLMVDETYRFTHSPRELIAAYANVSGKSLRRLPPPASAFSGIVQRRVVSVTSRIVFIMRRLYRRSQLRFYTLFEDASDRSELVATFLAVLELVKSRRIEVDESGEEVKFVGERRHPAAQ